LFSTLSRGLVSLLLTLTRLVVVFIFVNFSFALFTPPLGDYHSPRAPMTTVVLSPLRKQGDINNIPAAPTAVLLQDSGAPPTATIPRTQGSGTSLPDTLAHSYTPIVHLDPLLASIKGRSRALMREGHAGGRADEQAPSLSLSLPRERL
jgi:hypothetical protein